jgi:putative serine protease PepD
VHHTLQWRRAAGVSAAALLGGGIALGGAAGLGRLGERTTVIREEVLPNPAVPAAFRQESAKTINEIYRATAPGVVHINTQGALGSGFVLDKAGHIVTNYDVVRGARAISVSFSSNERIKARVVGVDPSTDVAVLAVRVKSRALRSLPLGDSAPCSGASRRPTTFRSAT